MQRHVRAALNRLRPIGLEEFGLAKAIENLLEFWRRRHPEIEFSGRLDIDEEGFGAILDPTIYRIVQEGLSNALRHAHPSRIAISITRATGGEEAIAVVVSDDGEGSNRPTPGFGLTGMRERVAAAGGSLTLGNRPGGGFAISAWLPLRMKGQLVAETADAHL
jgi:two-component system sensor histidine kinase UhpB